MKLYIGNLSYNTNKNDVKKMLEEFGPLDSFDWLTDEYTGKCRGFCFAEMNNRDADAAIKKLNGIEFHGRILKINEARARKNKRKKRYW